MYYVMLEAKNNQSMNDHVTGFNITMIFFYLFLTKGCLLAKANKNCQKLSKTDQGSETFKRTSADVWQISE